MKPRIFTREEIEKTIDVPELIKKIEEGLLLSSKGQVRIAPISMLNFEHPTGELHIKSGHITGDEQFVVKIASGFPENSQLGLSSSQGLMLLFSAKTGVIETVLLDEGCLTDLRTAIAGAVCAKHFAPKNIVRIGIAGTGIQAAKQLEILRYVTDCRDVIVWGRRAEALAAFANKPELAVFKIQTTQNMSEVCGSCDLIVTATCSASPLIFAKDLRPGIHITAVGADQPGKQEIAADAMERADQIFVDHLGQCLKYGDLSYAKERISMDKVQEIGAALNSYHRKPEAITIADLTGVAIEDVQIAKHTSYRRSCAVS
jgi:ornithine cyclodeaminase